MDKEEENIRNENGLIDYGKFEKLIDLNNEFVRKHFLAQ